MSALADDWLAQATGSRVKEFYSALGVELRGEGAEAYVSCFANPGAHANGDRSPSCSVSLVTGQFKCHGCGVQGNPYAAALVFNYTPQRAAEMARAHGLFINDTGKDKAPAPRLPDERQLLKWRNALLCSVFTITKDKGWTTVRQARTDPDSQEREMSRVLLGRLRELKGWTPTAIARCGLGWDGERIIFVVRDKKLKRVGVLRYHPNPLPNVKKMLAVKGTKRGLFPAPETMSRRCPLFVVEGETKVVSLRSVGLQAVAIPGATNWRPEYSFRLSGFRLVTLLDCDRAGRELGEQVSRSMPQARIVDLDPSRDDKYDVGDLVLEASQAGALGWVRRWLERVAA